MINRLAIVAALTLLPSAAIAQSATPASPAPSATIQMTPQSGTTGAAMAPGTATGLRTAKSATLAVRFATVTPSDFMATKLIGATVYNNQKEKLGEIEDLAIENGQDVTGIVVSVGGFLGIGESYVVLDPKTVVVNQKDGAWQAFVDTSKDTLKNAPKFTYSKKTN